MTVAQERKKFENRLTAQDYASFFKLKILREIVDRAGIFRVTREEAEHSLGIRLDCEGGVCFPTYLPQTNGNNASRPVSYSVRQDKPPRDANGKEERKYVTTAGHQYPYIAPLSCPAWFSDPTARPSM